MFLCRCWRFCWCRWWRGRASRQSRWCRWSCWTPRTAGPSPSNTLRVRWTVMDVLIIFEDMIIFCFIFWPGGWFLMGNLSYLGTSLSPWHDPYKGESTAVLDHMSDYVWVCGVSYQGDQGPARVPLAGVLAGVGRTDHPPGDVGAAVGRAGGTGRVGHRPYRHLPQDATEKVVRHMVVLSGLHTLNCF